MQSALGGKDAGAAGIVAGGPCFIANPTLTHHPVVCGGRAPPLFSAQDDFYGCALPRFWGVPYFYVLPGPLPKVVNIRFFDVGWLVVYHCRIRALRSLLPTWCERGQLKRG